MENITESAAGLTVYEAVNEALRERYLGVTAKDIRRAALEFAEHPPREVSHWNGEAPKALRGLASGLDKLEAKVFIDGYSSGALSKTWKILRGR